MSSRGQEITHEVQRLPHQYNFQALGACQGIYSKVRDKLVHLVLPTAKKEAQCLIDLFGFWVQQIPHVGIFLKSSYQMTMKPACWGEVEWEGQSSKRLCSRTRLLQQPGYLSNTRELGQSQLWRKQMPRQEFRAVLSLQNYNIAPNKAIVVCIRKLYFISNTVSSMVLDTDHGGLSDHLVRVDCW